MNWKELGTRLGNSLTSVPGVAGMALGGTLINSAFNLYRENTAYRRAKHDMEKAGLNPLYGINPASSSQTLDVGVNSALAVKQMQAQIDAQNESANLARAQALRELGSLSLDLKLGNIGFGFNKKGLPWFQDNTLPYGRHPLGHSAKNVNQKLEESSQPSSNEQTGFNKWWNRFFNRS